MIRREEAKAIADNYYLNNIKKDSEEMLLKIDKFIRASARVGKYEVWLQPEDFPELYAKEDIHKIKLQHIEEILKEYGYKLTYFSNSGKYEINYSY